MAEICEVCKKEIGSKGDHYQIGKMFIHDGCYETYNADREKYGPKISTAPHSLHPADYTEKEIKELSDKKLSLIIEQLIENKEYWNNTAPKNPSSIPDWAKLGYIDQKESILSHQKNSEACIKKFKRSLGAEKYNELANPDSNINKERRLQERRSNIIDNWIGRVMFGGIAFLVIAYFISIIVFYEECEEVTWTNMEGETETGRLCGEDREHIGSESWRDYPN